MNYSVNNQIPINFTIHNFHKKLNVVFFSLLCFFIISCANSFDDISQNHSRTIHNKVYIFDLVIKEDNQLINQKIKTNLKNLFNKINFHIKSQGFILSETNNKSKVNSYIYVTPLNFNDTNKQTIIGLGSQTIKKSNNYSQVGLEKKLTTVIDYGMDIYIDYKFAEAIFSINNLENNYNVYDNIQNQHDNHSHNINNNHQIDYPEYLRFIHSLTHSTKESLFDKLVLHEIGHGLGFDHSKDKNSIMYHTISIDYQDLNHFFTLIALNFNIKQSQKQSQSQDHVSTHHQHHH